LVPLERIRQNFPTQFVDSKNRDVSSALFGFQKDTTVISYVPKKGKVVLAASTLDHDNTIDQSTGEACKPEVPDESTLRNGKNKQNIGDNYIWISVDDTNDIVGRCVVTVCIGILQLTD
jgi:hypothetical protein